MIDRFLTWLLGGLRYECMGCGWIGTPQEWEGHIDFVHGAHRPGTPIWYSRVRRRQSGRFT